MNLKKSIISSLFLAIGLILHQITPPILMGMKPDFLLAMLFIILVLNSDNYKFVITISIIAGILTAATTAFPGGQIPNILDKLITCQFIYLLCNICKKFNDQTKIIIVSSLGTVISGLIFLISALFLFGLPAPIHILILTVVLPATLINTVVTVIFFNAVKIALKHTAY